MLGLGILLLIATIIGGISSEQLGVDLAMLTPAPLGFGIVATLLTGKGSGTSVGKPIGMGCGAGIVLTIAVVIFFVAIFPAL